MPPILTEVVWLYFAHRRLETVSSAVLGSLGASRGLEGTRRALMGSPSSLNCIGRSSTLANTLLYVLCVDEQSETNGRYGVTQQVSDNGCCRMLD